MNTIYTIYKATSLVNGKIYIGFCSCPYEVRADKHRRVAALGKTNSPFHNSIRKHGFKSFVWEAVYQSKDGQHCLNVMEPYFIREYDAVVTGYNLTSGGGGCLGYKWTAEQRREQSVRLTGLTRSEASKLNYSRASKGRKLPQSAKDTISKARANVSYVLTKPDGAQLRVLNLKKFCRENGLCARNMFMVLNGTAHQHKGWYARKA